jgi:hypothetical protein
MQNTWIDDALALRAAKQNLLASLAKAFFVLGNVFVSCLLCHGVFWHFVVVELLI